MTQSQNSNMTKLLNYFHYFTWKVQVGLAWLLSIQLPINKNFPADTLGLINWLVLLIVLFFLIMSECNGNNVYNVDETRKMSCCEEFK